MRILRSAEYEIVACIIQQVNQAGIAARNINNEFDDLTQYLVEIQRGTDRLADLVKDAELLPRQIQRFLDCFDRIIVASHYRMQARD